MIKKKSQKKENTDDRIIEAPIDISVLNPINEVNGDLLVDSSVSHTSKNGPLDKDGKIDLKKMVKDSRYNPFNYIHDDKDIEVFVKTIISSTNPSELTSGDPFWEKAETALFSALIAYLHYYCEPEYRYFFNIIKLLRAGEKINESDADAKSELDVLFEYLEEEDPGSFAYRQYQTFKMGAGKTCKSVLISCIARLESLGVKDEGDPEYFVPIPEYVSNDMKCKKATKPSIWEEVRKEKRRIDATYIRYSYDDKDYIDRVCESSRIKIIQMIQSITPNTVIYIKPSNHKAYYIGKAIYTPVSMYQWEIEDISIGNHCLSLFVKENEKWEEVAEYRERKRINYRYSRGSEYGNDEGEY